MEPINIKTKKVTQQEYQDALENIDAVKGKLHASTQARTVEKLATPEKENLQNQKNHYLNIIAQGPMAKYYGHGFPKRFTDISLSNRDVSNYLLDNISRLESYFEKTIKFSKEDVNVIETEYNNIGLGIAIESISLDTLNNLANIIQEYDENNQEIKIIQSVIAQANKDLSNTNEKIKSKSTQLDKLTKAMQVYEANILECDNNLKNIMDEYNDLNLALPIESIDVKNEGENLPKEVSSLKKRYDKIQSRKKIVEGHIKRNKNASSLLNAELKIMEVVRSTILERVDMLGNHFNQRIEEYSKNIFTIKEAYNSLNLAVPIESLDLAKCNKLIDLKKQYNQNIQSQKEAAIKMKDTQQRYRTLQDEIAQSKLALRELNAR